MAARTLAMMIVGASGALAKTFDPLPSTANCTVNWFNQTIDHFNWCGALPISRQRRAVSVRG